MDWNLFWTAFGAIGGTVGAIATFTAVLVALWQTKIAYKKKLQLSFSDNVSAVTNNDDCTVSFVGITVTNIGNRNIIIQDWGFLCLDKSRFLILPDASPIGRQLQVQLPHKLNVEEGISLYYNKELFRKAIKSCIEKRTLNPNKRLKFYVNDSTGKRYIVASKKTVNDLLFD